MAQSINRHAGAEIEIFLALGGGQPSAIAARALARWRHVARGATIVHFVVTVSYTAARRARLALAGWRLWAARRRGGVAVARGAGEVAVCTAPAL